MRPNPMNDCEIIRDMRTVLNRSQMVAIFANEFLPDNDEKVFTDLINESIEYLTQARDSIKK